MNAPAIQHSLDLGTPPPGKAHLTNMTLCLRTLLDCRESENPSARMGLFYGFMLLVAFNPTVLGQPLTAGGKLTLARVMTGQLNDGATLISSRGEAGRISSMSTLAPGHEAAGRRYAAFSGGTGGETRAAPG